MSRSTRRLIAPVIVLATAACLTACGSGSSSSGGGKKYVVGISNPAAAQSILSTTQKSFTEAAARDGISVKGLNANNDVNKQVQDIDQFVAQHVNAIVVYPIDPNALAPALNRAKAAHIKLIGWAAKLDPSGKASVAPYATNFDTGGTYRGAALLSKFVSEKLGGKGNALGVGLGFPVPALIQMIKQYQSGVTDGTQVTWLGSVDNPTDDVAGAQKVVATALTKYKNNVQAVMGYNDDSAIGAAVALKNAGVTNAVVVGQNGDKQGAAAVKSGQISAVVDLVPWKEGLILETLTKAILNNKKVPTSVVNPSELYTQDNIDQRLDWDKALAEIKSGKLSCTTKDICPSDIAALR